MSDTRTRAAIDAVWRSESARLIAGVLRIVRNVDLAEEFAHDALVAALQQWPQSGIPANPAGWLISTAKHRAIDLLRRNKMADRRHAELELGAEYWPDPEASLDDCLGDDLLRLIFIACHPILSREARVALTLRLLGGLTTEEIARAFLIPEATVAQRIVRAKRTLSEARVPFENPDAAQISERLPSVLEVIYLIFNEGYAATSGDDWTRPELCQEALRLARILAGVVPDESEVHGLVALIALQASRLPARAGPSGEAVLLLDQDRNRWDQYLIRSGLDALERARSLCADPGTYTLQAALAACHARAASVQDTNWKQIVTLYEQLLKVMPSPVVELNRAVAVSMVDGPEAALHIVDALAADPIIRDYQLLPGLRGDLLMKLGRYVDARQQFERAVALTQNKRERDLLLSRAAECTARMSQP